MNYLADDLPHRDVRAVLLRTIDVRLSAIQYPYPQHGCIYFSVIRLTKACANSSSVPFVRTWIFVDTPDQQCFAACES